MEGVAPPFAAVLFDLDGVLRNTEPYHRMAYAQLARSLSGGAPPDAGEIAGKSNLQLYEALVARFGGPATAEELSQRHFRLVCQLLEEYRVGPMPGLEEALDALRRRGIPFGVVSSSWRWYVEHCLRELGMYEDAAVIVTGSDGLPSSPPPPLIRRRPGSFALPRPARCWPWRTAAAASAPPWRRVWPARRYTTPTRGRRICPRPGGG